MSPSFPTTREALPLATVSLSKPGILSTLNEYLAKKRRVVFNLFLIAIFEWEELPETLGLGCHYSWGQHCQGNELEMASEVLDNDPLGTVGRPLFDDGNLNIFKFEKAKRGKMSLKKHRPKDSFKFLFLFSRVVINIRHRRTTL